MKTFVRAITISTVLFASGGLAQTPLVDLEHIQQTLQERLTENVQQIQVQQDNLGVSAMLDKLDIELHATLAVAEAREALPSRYKVVFTE